MCVAAMCVDGAVTRGLCKRHYRRWWKARRRRPWTDAAPIDAALVTDAVALSWDGATAAERVAWLAGLLEGEATFSLHRQGARAYPRVSVQMTDRSVLDRAMSLISGSFMYESGRRRSRSRGWKDVWEVVVNGAAAADVMQQVRPWMGLRRAAAIDLALSQWDPVRLSDAPATCVVAGCHRRHRSRGLCNTHYMSWSRDLKRGVTPRVTPLR
jgi:hypothetical protein